MLPVGVPVPGATAAAVPVKVTAWPTTDGLTDEVRVVVVAMVSTTCVRAVDVEVL